MASKYESEKNKLQAQIRESAEASRTEQARITNEYEGRLAELEKKIRDGASAPEILELRRKILMLEAQIANVRRPEPTCLIV